MTSKSIIPKHKQDKLWILAILLILSFGLFVLWNVNSRGVFEYVGVDYRLWYSSGMIARYHGFASIYDVDLQSQYQYPLYEQYSKNTPMSIDFWPLPLPYLPVFIAPFLVFTIFPPSSGFLFWSFLNFFGTLLYISRFLKRENLAVPLKKYYFVFLALPFFLNIIFGQINLWLLVCMGEIVLSIKKGKDFKSGVWLGGLLLKPQLLILFIPGLLLTKRIKMLSGLFCSSILIMITSYILAGQTAITGPIDVISHWPTVLGDSGMNLLSLANNLSKIIPFELSRLIGEVCTIIVILATMWLWLPRNKPLENENIEWLLSTTFAATCTISPHSNVHMAIPMLALCLVVYAKKQIPTKLALGWILIPSILFLLLSIVSVGNAHAIGGMAVLGMNIVFIMWMIWKKYTRSVVVSPAP